MSYRNYMEEAVINSLDSVLDKLTGICTCARCKEDIVALTLNHLPPKYIVTELGHMYTKFDQMQMQCKTDITVQLTNAAKIVEKNPRH